MGKVTIYTYGEVKPVELMPLLETILRVNGATIVKVGEFYRIVPINAISKLPLPPVTNVGPENAARRRSDDPELIFLKYTHRQRKWTSCCRRSMERARATPCTSRPIC